LNAEIIAVGTELLLGDITNTNAQYLSQELATLGINVYRHTVVGDNLNRLQVALGEAFCRCDLVVTTGGLGPTADDITKEAVAAYFGLEMQLHDPSLEQIADFFIRIGSKMTENNRRQAIFPVDSLVLHNPVGTAPGCIVERDGKICILLPGPPREMKTMFGGHAKPYLVRFSTDVLVSRTLRLVGIGESSMEAQIADILAHQTNPSIAPYAFGRAGEVVLRISAKAANEDAAHALMQPTADMLYKRLGDYIYGEDDDSLPAVIVDALAHRELTLATAESITGGSLSAAIVGVSGASRVFNEGFVTYSNESKINQLEVSRDTLKKYGAVSAEVAMEMAAGAAKRAGSSIAISTTGIAGPDGGTAEKPVGLTYIGLCCNGKLSAKKYMLFGDRNRIRDRAVAHALDSLRGALKNQ